MLLFLTISSFFIICFHSWISLIFTNLFFFLQSFYHYLFFSAIFSFTRHLSFTITFLINFLKIFSTIHYFSLILPHSPSVGDNPVLFYSLILTLFFSCCLPSQFLLLFFLCLKQFFFFSSFGFSLFFFFTHIFQHPKQNKYIFINFPLMIRFFSLKILNHAIFFCLFFFRAYYYLKANGWLSEQNG